jgi:hypothetical protein
MSYYHIKPSLGTPLNPHHPLSRGLVGAWLFNESGGLVLRDNSLHRNHGTLVGGSIWTGGGLSFDGVNNYVDCGEGNGNFDIGAGTWLAQIYPTSFVDHPYHTVIAKNFLSAWWFGLFSLTGRLQFWVAGIQHTSVSAVNLNKWSRVAATWDRNIIKYYINGIHLSGEDNIEVGAPVTNDDSVGIGMDPKHGKYAFTGIIKETFLYSCALPDSEIAWLNREPYAMFEQPSRAKYFYVAAGGETALPMAINYYRQLRS